MHHVTPYKLIHHKTLIDIDVTHQQQHPLPPYLPKSARRGQDGWSIDSPKFEPKSVLPKTVTVKSFFTLPIIST